MSRYYFFDSLWHNAIVHSVYPSTWNEWEKFKICLFSGPAFEEEEGVHVFTDGGCFDNGRNGARAGIGVYWGRDDPK